MAPPSIATDIKQYIDERDAIVEERVKGWLIRAVLRFRHGDTGKLPHPRDPETIGEHHGKPTVTPA